jgi:ATPase
MELIQWNNSILDQYFDAETMSVHIKANCKLLKKKGRPWAWASEVSEEIFTKQQTQELIERLYNEIQWFSDSWLEIDRKYSKVLQVWPYRIVIVEEPLADGLEITIVKPVKKLSIGDYELTDEVLELLRDKSKGMLISWSPGSGKTTFAQALIELYVADNKIIKTIESPRDLLVPEEVVQYSFSYAPHYEIRDILLLSRPDVAVYDEVRNKEDFELFKDLRLTGIWLIWVIHATAPVDSIQRFIGTIEMWIIPQVVDTVIYISGGKIEEILQLKTVVKTPSGMMSADLARPVIEVSSFLTKQLRYEIYTYWEQVVVMPLESIQAPQSSAILEKAGKSLQKDLEASLWIPLRVEVMWARQCNIYINTQNKWQIIGKAWSNIIALEKELWMSISVIVDDKIAEKSSAGAAWFSTGGWYAGKSKNKRR